MNLVNTFLKYWIKNIVTFHSSPEVGDCLFHEIM